MPRITSRNTGHYRFENTIRNHTLIVDQPIGSGGTDEGPTPLELLATSLGTCVGIYAVFFCEKYNIATEGMVVHTDFDKTNNPARVGKLAITIELPAGVPRDKTHAFMETVHRCLIHNTLCNTPEITMALDERSIVE